jgi:hypothetical protein
VRVIRRDVSSVGTGTNEQEELGGTAAGEGGSG